MAVAGETRAFLRNGPSALLAAAAATAACFIVLFWEAFGNLWMRWGEQQELSHSYFIPLISAWLVWSNRRAVRASIGAPSWAGVGIVAFAGLLHLVGQLTHIFVFQHIAIVVAIAGLVAGFGGLSLLRVTAVPVAFLLFAVPPPYWVITVLSWKFQQMSSVLGVAMIRMMDIPVFLSGNIIDLGNYKLQVAEACSGLRYLFPFLSLGVMTAYLFRGALWQKLVIVASTIPITIVMNSFRIAVTGALVQAYGPEHAEGALHFFEGWVVFLFCLAALYGVVLLLCALSRPRLRAADALGAPSLAPIPPGPARASPFAVMGAILAVAIGLVAVSKAVTTDTLIIPERQAFSRVPAEFPEWRHEILPMDPSVAEALGADDSIVVNLFSPEGGFVNLYMAYLEAQRDGRSWHSPRQCIPGGGWQIARHDILERRTTGGDDVNYNRLIIQSGDQRQLVYYWYDQRGRKMANEFVMKLWLIVDAVTRNRSDGALVRLITPIINEEGIEAADARLMSMMDRVEEFMPAYAPE